jgi:hypothetical protein
VWIVTTDAAISAKPDNTFAIRKDRVDVIRTQSAGSSIEREALRLRFRNAKDAAPVSANPHLVFDSLQRHHWTSWSFVPFQTESSFA